MRVLPHLPDLTPEEAERAWLRPAQVLEVAALDARHGPTRQWFDNTVHRSGFVPREPRRAGSKIAVSAFSLASCVVLRAMFEETARGRGMRAAEAIGCAVADLLPAALAFPTLRAFREAEREGEPWRVLLVDAAPGDGAVRVHAIDGAEFTAEAIMARDWWGMSCLFPHHLLLRCIETYTELWAEARDREPGPRAAPRVCA